MVRGSIRWGLTIGKTGETQNGNPFANSVGNWGETKEPKKT